MLLLSWNQRLEFTGNTYNFLEVFAGEGAVSKRMSGTQAVRFRWLCKGCFTGLRHALGYRTASLDLDYSEKHMNFLEVSRFLSLV